MTPRRLAGPCRALLGAVAGPVLVAGPKTAAWRAALSAAGVPLAADGESVAAAVLVFVSERGDPTTRASMLATVAARLVPGAPIVLVDHNQPRAPWRRPAAWIALLRHGLPPHRARYPAARELTHHGFTVDCLRLPPGERLQLIRAHRSA